ncbi:arsenate reductase ArsC [Candidatus Bathyarchaeota archaeon]|nr:arsenate reductase ArsC [Candidatus Bathyarchaeota archaeon]
MHLKKRVLFICTHNSARSQMAEGLMNALYGDRYEAYSAGTEPTQVSPYATKVMAEAGIDISRHYSKSLEQFRGCNFDYVVTVCDRAKESCPFFPEAQNHLHVSFKDPSRLEGSEEEIIAEYRRLMSQIRNWLARTFG